MRFLILILLTTLSGCAATKPAAIPVHVQCPKPNIPQEPHYPVQDLEHGDKPDKVMKAYVATVKGQHDYIEQLKHVLKGYE